MFTQHTQKSLSLFSGRILLEPLIEIEIQKMRDAGTLKVECPECLTMRGLTPQGGAIRFPSHDPRKTRTPHHEARWVRREGIWELAGR